MFQDYIKSKVIIAVVLVLAVIIGFCYWPKYGWKVSRFLSTRFGTTFFIAKNKPGPMAATHSAIANGGAQTGAIEEGKHFQKLPAKITSNATVQQFIAKDPGKIQVISFISYACFWCQRLHPQIEQWLGRKPESVVFYRFPVNFHHGWDKLAKAFYMVEQLGRSKELDPVFFDAIHQKHINLADDKILKDFFQKHGVDEAKFNEMYNSFAINVSYSNGNTIANAFQVTLSPIFIVNTPTGSYLLSAGLAGSEQRVMEVLEYVINKSLAGELSSGPSPIAATN